VVLIYQFVPLDNM